MKCKIISITHKPSDWEKLALEFYLKQIPKNLQLNFAEIKPSASKSLSEIGTLKTESIEISKHLNDESYIILWDRKGKAISSKFFADLLQEKIDHAQELTFVIGGAYGVSPEILKRANLTLSASSLTFPHRLFKILLMEQLFRASAINRNHPYHK